MNGWICCLEVLIEWVSRLIDGDSIMGVRFAFMLLTCNNPDKLILVSEEQGARVVWLYSSI